jgi:hypothetical protein
VRRERLGADVPSARLEQHGEQRRNDERERDPLLRTGPFAEQDDAENTPTTGTGSDDSDETATGSVRARVNHAQCASVPARNTL